MLTCARCGSAIFVGASDCPKCGHVVGTNVPTSASSSVSADASAPDTEPQSSLDPALSPLANLWRGNYNLPKAFWGFGVAATFGLAILYFGAMVLTRPNRALQDAIVHYGWLALLAWNVFVVVGVWRSGTQYTRRGGNIAWVFFSRASALVGLAQMLYIAVRLLNE